MICPNCNQNIDGDFCPFCGFELSKENIKNFIESKKKKEKHNNNQSKSFTNHFKIKNFKVLIIVLCVITYIWFLINYDDILKMNEMHKISYRKSLGFTLSKSEDIKFKNYMQEMYEIKLRGCSIGAKVIFLKCGFTDSVSKYALGKYDDYINKKVFEEKYNIFKIKPRF